MPITFGGRLSFQDLPMAQMNGVEIIAQKTLKYLGITWDSSFTFAEHFKLIRKKEEAVTYRLSSVAERFYWRQQNLFRRIYSGAIEPYILYGHRDRSHKLQLAQIKSLLSSIK